MRNTSAWLLSLLSLAVLSLLGMQCAQCMVANENRTRIMALETAPPPDYREWRFANGARISCDTILAIYDTPNVSGYEAALSVAALAMAQVDNDEAVSDGQAKRAYRQCRNGFSPTPTPLPKEGSLIAPAT